MQTGKQLAMVEAQRMANERQAAVYVLRRGGQYMGHSAPVRGWKVAEMVQPSKGQ